MPIDLSFVIVRAMERLSAAVDMAFGIFARTTLRLLERAARLKMLRRNASAEVADTVDYVEC
jgi:hypothetical protein